MQYIISCEGNEERMDVRVGQDCERHIPVAICVSDGQKQW